MHLFVTAGTSWTLRGAVRLRAGVHRGTAMPRRAQRPASTRDRAWIRGSGHSTHACPPLAQSRPCAAGAACRRRGGQRSRAAGSASPRRACPAAPTEVVRVVDVHPDSPAQQAGVQKGDTIVRIDNRAATGEMMRRCSVAPGDTVRLRIRRGGREQVKVLVAEARPARLRESIVFGRGEVRSPARQRDRGGGRQRAQHPHSARIVPRARRQSASAAADVLRRQSEARASARRSSASARWSRR